MNYLWAFIVGGIICAIAQILIDKFKLTPARILVIYVVAGVVLTMLGIYEPLVDFAGAGATVPLTGFGYSLAKGALTGIREKGAVGILAGGVSGTAAGIAAAVFFGFIIALIAKPKEKK